MKVIIAGGGIGGLTTALMLHARNMDVQVYETAATIREAGVGINILPHAIRELEGLGLLGVLDKVGLRTKSLTYFTKSGQEVWSELRGMHAGHEVPQFTIHRGRLQKLLFNALLERAGPNAVVTGRRLAGFVQNEGGVTANFVDTLEGAGGITAQGDVLVCADGIHSCGRKIFYPDESRPSWNGVMMWRGASEWPSWRDGESMAIGGGLGGKFVLYPIETPKNGKQLMNWVVNIRTKDPEITPPPDNSWSRGVSLSTVLPHALRFAIPDFDIEGLVRATDGIFEYPMADRDPLPRWTFGRVTLLGDAAHPMYPVGSNGASQAILDARCLSDQLQQSEHPRAALWFYEKQRLPVTAEIVENNRKGGPEGVIDEVEKLAPAGFENVDEVLSYEDRKAIVSGYALKAGFSKVKAHRAS